MNSDPETDYTQKMKTELERLIDALTLEDLPKQFLKSRWLDQLVWMEGASQKYQRLYYVFRLSCIIGGVMIPALVTWNVSGTMGSFIHLMTVLLSLIVAVSAAVEEFFHFGERWRHYRRTAELLKGEGWAFLQLNDQYDEYANHNEAYPEFAGRMEETFQKEVEIFITKVSKEKQETKEKAKG